MKVAATDGALSPGNTRDLDDIGIYAITGGEWADVGKTEMKAAENLWVYEVVLLGEDETRSVLTHAVANRQIFPTVTITFPSRTSIDDDPGERVVAEAGTDTFTDVVFFWKHGPRAGLPFERYYFAAIGEGSQRPKVLEQYRARGAPADPADHRRRYRR